MSPSLMGWLPSLLAWQEMDFGGPAAKEPSALELTIVLIVVALFLLVLFVIGAFVCYLLSECLKRLPPQFRLMEPSQTYLLLIPCFNYYWNFEVFLKIPRSYRAYFNSIGRYDVGDCGEQLGLWGSILIACGLIPCVGGFISPIGGIMFLILLIKLWGYRSQIIPVGKMT